MPSLVKLYFCLAAWGGRAGKRKPFDMGIWPALFSKHYLRQSGPILTIYVRASRSTLMIALVHQCAWKSYKEHNNMCMMWSEYWAPPTVRSHHSQSIYLSHHHPCARIEILLPATAKQANCSQDTYETCQPHNFKQLLFSQVLSVCPHPVQYNAFLWVPMDYKPSELMFCSRNNKLAINHFDSWEAACKCVILWTAIEWAAL